MNGFKTEYMRVLGFYDFVNSPTVLSPYHVENEHPGITEMHESIHRDLARGTTTGVLSKVILIILHEAKNLPENLINSLNSAVDSILENSVLVHESAATYLPLILFFKDDPDNAEKFVSKLPSPYRNALSLFENSIGSPRENATDESLDWILPFIMSVSTVALSPPCIQYAQDVTSLGKLESYISANSPNARLSHLVQKLVEENEIPFLREFAIKHKAQNPGSNPANILELHDLTLARVIQFAENNRISSCADDRKILTDIESLIRVWNNQLLSMGISSLNEVRIRDTRKHSADADLDISYKMPTEDSLAQVDTSFGFNFVPQDDKISHIFEGSVRGEYYLFLNLIPDPSFLQDSRKDFRHSSCLVFGYSWPKMPISERDDRYNLDTRERLKPFSFEATNHNILELLENYQSKMISVKFRESFARVNPIKEYILSIPNPVFIVCEDTTMTNIVERIDDEVSRCGRVNLVYFNLGKKGANALTINNDSDQIHWTALFSPIGWNHLKKDKYHLSSKVSMIDGLTKQSNLLEVLQLEEMHIYALLYTTYCF